MGNLFWGVCVSHINSELKPVSTTVNIQGAKGNL